MSEKIQQDKNLTLEEQQAEEARINAAPKGAISFAVLMMIFYIIYFGLTYYEVVILRGGN